MELNTIATVRRMAGEAARLRQHAHEVSTSAELRAKYVSELEDKLTTERRELAREQDEQQIAFAEAEDLAAIVAQLCADNGWEIAQVQPQQAAALPASQPNPGCICMIGQPARLDCPVHGDVFHLDPKPRSLHEIVQRVTVCICGPNPGQMRPDCPIHGNWPDLGGSVEDAAAHPLPEPEPSAETTQPDEPEQTGEQRADATAGVHAPSWLAILAVLAGFGLWWLAAPARARKTVRKHAGRWRVFPYRGEVTV
jgi:hypothetical protein